MIYHTVTVKNRPIKLAFLVNYGDKAALRKAIQINSVLWGGRYNPIIPVYSRVPSKYKGLKGYGKLKRDEIVTGYLSAFDPDYIVNLSSIADNALPVRRKQLIKEDDIFEQSVRRRRSFGRHETHYGVGLLEILDHLVETEYKYVRKVPLPIIDVQFGERHPLFFGSVFGEYSAKVRDQFDKRYGKTIGITPKKISMASYIDMWQSNAIGVRNVCNTFFDVLGSGGPRTDTIFLLDPNSWQDVVDNINLRATGERVFSIPLTIADDAATIAACKAFVDRNYRKYNDNNVFYETTILKSRDVDQDTFLAFSAQIVEPPAEPHKFKSMQQDWYPRMWDMWARSRDGHSGATLEHRTSSHEFTNTDDINLPILRPDFLDDESVFWKPKFANEISIRSYGDDEFRANVFPTNIDRADRVLGHFAAEEWRFSANGIVYLPNHSREVASFKLPSSDRVFEEWQKTLGVHAVTSNPGKLAQQIVKKIGADRLNLLSYEGFIKIIERLTKTKGMVQPISYEDLWGKIQAFTAEHEFYGYNAESYLQWILHKGIFELGTNVLCDNCNRSTWFPLEGLSSSVKCAVCLEDIVIGQVEPKSQMKWAYRPIGPFSVPDLAQGAFTVVLSLYFFAEVMGIKITPRYSFESKDGKYEADFAALTAGDWRDGEGILQIVGEAKSFGKPGKSQFSDAEISKLLKLAEKSDNSVIVFATLNRTLAPADKTRFKRLIIKLRKQRFNGKNVPEVLILTGNELFSRHDLKDTWSKLGAPYESYLDNIQRAGIKELCNTTQQIYLDVESYWDFFEEQMRLARAA